MQICEREGLHQVDLLTPSKTHIRDGEYRAGQHGQEKLDELNERIRAAQMKPTQTVFLTQKQFLRESVKSAAERASSLKEINAQIHFAGGYYAARAVHADFLKAWNKKKFRETHRGDLDKYDEAVRYFRDNGDGTIPSMKSLRERKEELSARQARQGERLQSHRQFRKDLQTALANVDAILGTGMEHEKPKPKKRISRGMDL